MHWSPSVIRSSTTRVRCITAKRPPVMFLRYCVLVLALIAAMPACCNTTARAQRGVPIKREILALYDGAREGAANATRIHRFAELPLNHLGFILRYHDVRLPLPAYADLVRYRGVFTWFVGPVAN